MLFQEWLPEIRLEARPRKDGVVNNLTVGERTVGNWLGDVVISSKVKSKLIANAEIKARN
jgi:osmotically-inducible protein OsmY